MGQSSAQTISDMRISNELNVPLKLIRSLRRRSYIDGVEQLRNIAVSERLLKQYAQDVERLKATFARIFKHPAYFSSTPDDRIHDFDAMIVYYIDCLGVEALEKNMQHVSMRRSNIRSIVFFFFTKDQASPWEKLRDELMAGKGKVAEWVIEDRKRYASIKMQIFTAGYPLHLRKAMMQEMNIIKRRLRSNGYVL